MYYSILSRYISMQKYVGIPGWSLYMNQTTPFDLVCIFQPSWIKYLLPEHPKGYKSGSIVNTLRPRQNGRHFPDDILKWIFFNENVWISIAISLQFVPKGQINNILALVQMMAWRRPGDKPLSEPMMVSLLTHTCITPPQWVRLCIINQSI